MIKDLHVEREIVINGIKIPVWFYGDSKNPPIIFIHGYLKGFSDYIGDLPPRYLKDKYFVIAFDLPRFGKSKNLKISNDDFLHKILNKFVKGKVILFGASYGGAVALRFAKNHPDKVSRIIIAATPFYPRIKILNPIFRGKLKFISDFAFMNKSDLSDLKIPVLLFYGPNDRKAFVWMGRRLSNILPNSKLVIVPDRIHSWFLHRIDESGILSEIENFLA